MKSTKGLLLALIATALTSMNGIFASTYAVTSIVNANVPGFNGSYTTPTVYIDTVQMGRHHMVNNVSVSRELDIRVRSHGAYGITSGDWRILSNGSVTQLTDSLSPANLYMQGGNFDLYIDSRWYYTSGTTIYNANWYLDSLT